MQPLVNVAIGSGQWLKRPLKIRGIHDEKISRCILKALIFELNCMFIDLAEKKDENGDYYFKNLYHIDCRGTALTEDDWWDEIHLHSEGFEKIAKAYKYCMENKPAEKVIKVQNMPDLSNYQMQEEKCFSAVPN